ncbi:hypothetical protein ACFY8W_00095 [Streptomyces sp. NPDC012637]|uniref:hypothetical protein n=1 Tax=Streptomyces sp. NPDC012637 TaxID=3364842 RepID=UPI0036E02453
MENCKITWVQDGHDGRRESTVSFGLAAAEAYLPQYEARAGVSDVQIMEAPIQLVRSRRRSA